MGTRFVLVSPCFRENVAVTCKIGSFLCSLDNLLQKNVIVIFFGNQISKWRSCEKGAIFDLLFTFFSHQGKVTKICKHISHSHTCILLTLLTFLPYQLWKKKWIYQVWFLFGMSPGVDSYSHHFGTINKITKHCKLECLLLICVYTNAKFIVICKLRTLNDGGEDSVQYRNCKKHCFLQLSHLEALCSNVTSDALNNCLF